MEAAAKLYMTEEEYLAFDRASDIKHEFFNGEVFAMAGGSLAYNTLCMNFGAALTTRLRGKPCLALTSDQRVRLKDTKAYCYPDLSVVCGKPQMQDARKDVLENPTIVVEVLSPSTAAEDLSAKLSHYRRTASVRQIVFVDSRRLWVQTVNRTDNDDWLLTDYREQEDLIPIVLPEETLHIPVAELYDKVEWDAGETGRAP